MSRRMNAFLRNLLLAAFCCALIDVCASANDLPVDPIQPNSVWTDGTKRSLTILERHGDKFRASFISGAGNVREIFGSVKDGRISWLAKDVHAADASIGSGD